MRARGDGGQAVPVVVGVVAVGLVLLVALGRFAAGVVEAARARAAADAVALAGAAAGRGAADAVAAANGASVLEYRDDGRVVRVSVVVGRARASAAAALVAAGHEAPPRAPASTLDRWPTTDPTSALGPLGVPSIPATRPPRAVRRAGRRTRCATRC